MPEETVEEFEHDEGFLRGWSETVRSPIGELRDKSAAWVEGYRLGERARESFDEWGGRPETSGPPYLPPFCVIDGAELARERARRRNLSWVLGRTSAQRL